MARNLVNRYRQPDGSTPIPDGGILDQSNEGTVAHSGRFQAGYSGPFWAWHSNSTLAGAEIRTVFTTVDGYRIYGYDDETHLSRPVDFASFDPLKERKSTSRNY